MPITNPLAFLGWPPPDEAHAIHEPFEGTIIASSDVVMITDNCTHCSDG